MISLGRNITQAGDPLSKISLKTLADKIRNPNQRFINFMEQLRKVQSIDQKKYRQLKTKLPYVVAATFNPNYRKIEHFAHTSYFILDIDHLSEKEIDMESLFEKLKKDDRIALLFHSPSNDGLKLFFKVNEAFYDAGKYSLFYKIFAEKFALEYNLLQVIDKKTSDVSRACFVSYDPQIFYNEKVREIIIEHYINFEDELQVFDATKMLQEKQKEHKENGLMVEDVSMSQHLPDDIIRNIREKLNPKIKEKREKQIFVPEELNTIVDLISLALKQYDIEIKAVKNIHYGKQFLLKLQHHVAEINVFYGKRGFTIVKSNKAICNSELIDIAHDIIYSVIM